MIRRSATTSLSSSSARVGRPGHDAGMLDHVRAGGAAPADGIEVGQPLGERDRERGVEGVARAGRVDRRRGERGHAHAVELARPASPSVSTTVARALAHRSGLRLVRRHVVDLGRDRLLGAGAGLRIVRTPGAARDLERVERRVDGDLELHEADVGARDPLRERVDVRARRAARARPGR